MLGFLYLILILGWILIVIFLKCKKSLATHFAFADNYTQNVERHPSVHVIQLQPDDLRDGHYIHSHHHHPHYQRHMSVIDVGGINTYPTDAVINPAYANDEEYIINAPPPSYEEVMRQPEVYPKVHEAIKSQSNQNSER